MPKVRLGTLMSFYQRFVFHCSSQVYFLLQISWCLLWFIPFHESISCQEIHYHIEDSGPLVAKIGGFFCKYRFCRNLYKIVQNMKETPAWIHRCIHVHHLSSGQNYYLFILFIIVYSFRFNCIDIAINLMATSLQSNLIE